MDEIPDWLLMTGGTVILLTVTILGSLALSKASCDEVGEQTHRKTHFEPIGGCFVEVNGRMIPRSAWREFD